MLVFKDLWSNHPTINNDGSCESNGIKHFPNQCAIRLGISLRRCGIDTSKIPGATHCWYHAKNEGHIIRAEELAIGLAKFPISGMQEVIKIEPKNFDSSISGKKGIIFFKDYWQRTANGKKEIFHNRSGDHIDLWNISRLTDLSSWVRIHLRIGRFGLHSISDAWSDFEDSKSIWFWNMP